MLFRSKETAWVGGRSGNGLIKIGQTTRGADLRIGEQVNPVKMPTPTEFETLLVEAAITEDGRVFSDKEVHAALADAGFHKVDGTNEWFECTKDEVRAAIRAVRNGESLPSVRPVFDFKMRPEQIDAVALTAVYFRGHPAGEGDQAPDFLWNAKMRYRGLAVDYKQVITATSPRKGCSQRM